MKAIGGYTLSNNSGIVVYDIDYTEDKVLAAFVYFKDYDEAIWCDITYEDDRCGFKYNELFIPFDEVMRL